MRSIIEELTQNPEFHKFSDLISDTKIARLLKTKGPYTVFAPGKRAFEVFSDNFLGDLFDNKEDLAILASNHVVIGNYTLKDLTKVDEVNNLSNTNLEIELLGNKILIDGAIIISGDIFCENGIIHLIDTLIK